VIDLFAFQQGVTVNRINDQPARRSGVAQRLWDRLALPIAAGHARASLKRLLSATDDAIAVQHRVLCEKIRRNASSDFGRRFRFSTIRSYDDYVARVPVLKYEDLEPYIEQVKTGHTRAMFSGRQRVHMFAKTSGTTDRPKHVPVTSAFLQDYRKGWNAFGVTLYRWPAQSTRNMHPAVYPAVRSPG